MTDLTTRPADAGTPGPVLVPVNGVADVKTLRQASRAEQDRLNADAAVDRRARAALLELELREQRQAAVRREHQAKAEDKRVRQEQRRARRAARRAKAPEAALRWAERALFVLPILFPMAVAWAGQIRFAMGVMGWSLPAAVVFAAGFELSTAYVARLDWRSRAAGDGALLFRGATWAFAGGAAVMNYWHAAGPALAPNGEAVSYGLMSITGVVLWELLSTYRHRTALRAEGKLPAARPRFGLARWIWFANLTYLAWLLALRDGFPTTDLAWRAALSAVEMCGSARAARKAVRAGRPVPWPELLDIDANVDADERDGEHDVPHLPVDPAAAGRPGDDRDERDAVDQGERDGNQREGERDITSKGRAGTGPVGDDRDERDDPADDTAGDLADDTDDMSLGAGTGPGHDRRSAGGDRAVRARMEAYARDRLAAGASITGADLDRQFGTRDYGRKVLRRLGADR